MSNDASRSGTVGPLCPVGRCRRPLTRIRGGLVCARAHSFDVARSGYVNLLLPQNRRSRNPGDAPATVAARLQIEARGYETPLRDAITDFLTADSGDAVLDVGCGDGHHLATIVARFGCEGHGLDISVAAIEDAARQHPGLHWIMANAGWLLPYADASFRLLGSITAQRDPGEFRRVLRDDGSFLLVIPAVDDLIEIRELILGQGLHRDRVEKAIDAFSPIFALKRHERIRSAAHLDAATVHDVMASSYRAGRASRQARLAAVSELDVTLSRDALLFQPARPAGEPRRRKSHE
jgi:23S rRNA (guanine745-N1)-methyltransferase